MEQKTPIDYELMACNLGGGVMKRFLSLSKDVDRYIQCNNNFYNMFS